ncbi:MAG TPA: Smr/MutS family protein [Longimicrobiaceae bacterium]|nr:Smr/MutS family protein [Longimicrobiaceae bacterium]
MARRKRRSSAPRTSAWDEVHPSLDLHGMTADEARRRAEAWLRELQREGVRIARVITGRGARSIGPPVLRGEIGELLEALRGSLVSSYVLDFGGGAFRVELEQIRSQPLRPVPPAPRPVPPDLRARAEEALWELGVEPTPALLETEIRRLAREAAEGS